MATDPRPLAQQVGEALERRDRAAFVALTRRLFESAPAMNEGYKSLAQPLLDFGELGLAREAIDRYAAANDHDIEARFDQALIYTRAVGPEAAMERLAGVPADFPDVAGRAYLEGTMAMNLGRTEQAEAALLRAQRARPHAGPIYQSLSALGPMSDHPAIADTILAAAPAMSGAAELDRATFLYALGKVHDDRGEHPAAFAAFAEGAALLARLRPYKPAPDRQAASLATEGWDRATIDRVGATIAQPTDAPIIVTGLPRSGTTLVEHILASHSAVSDGDELGRFGLVASQVGGLSADHLQRWGQPASVATDLYLHLFRERFPAGRAVDKSLEASRYMGLLAAILPQAPIVWLRRDPLDTAWSAFRTFFLRGVDWSWSLETIADHMALEDRLFAHWRDLLGDRLLVVDYEQLVSDKEAQIGRILNHCGLAPEAATLTPERSQRAVTTNSVAQVRAPISTRAVGSAEPYRAWLGPFVERYAAPS